MEAINLLSWENDVLGIVDKMKPAVSSHTQSGNDVDKEAGAPKTESPADSTETNRDNA
jgi:hypothetical protein